MNVSDVGRLVATTADASFAVDGAGTVVAWNDACAALLGAAPSAALGRRCLELVCGVDEAGPVCARDCCVLRAMQSGRPIPNFDVQLKTTAGLKWCNISVLRAAAPNRRGWSIHVVREVDLRKRLEMLVGDFVGRGLNLPAEAVAGPSSLVRSPRRGELTPQELAVVRLLARGAATADIARSLGISTPTVNNHVAHILKKLDAHSRLEAIRRAEKAGLL